MKTETRIYDDGTEPDVLRRWCCDGKCEQGRICPKIAPPPAEACTDVGHFDDDGVETFGAVILLGIIVVAIIATISFIVGYYL